MRTALAALACLLSLGGTAVACSLPDGVPWWCNGDCSAQQTMLVVQNRRCKANRSMPPAFLHSARITQQPSVGRASTSSDGSYTYEPKAGFTGRDRFVVEFDVQELRTTKRDTKTLTVNVEVKPPASADLSECRFEGWRLTPGAELTVPIRVLLGGACKVVTLRNPTRQPLTVAVPPRQGVLERLDEALVTYRSRADARGGDRFDLIVEYNNGAESSRLKVEVAFVDVL